MSSRARAHRSMRSSNAPLPERRAGLPRECSFGSSYCTASQVRERFDSLAAAFLADPRPGLIFERGRAVVANDAARRLLAPEVSSCDFLRALKLAIEKGSLSPDLLLRTRSGTYAPVLHPHRDLKRHPAVVCFLVRRSRRSAAFSSLSDRELEVLRALIRGLTNRQIAEELHVSIETVRKHISHALRKTGATTRAGLVGRALISLST